MCNDSFKYQTICSKRLSGMWWAKSYVWFYLKLYLRYLCIFRNPKTIVYLLNTMFIYEECQAVMKTVKYIWYTNDEGVLTDQFYP